MKFKELLENFDATGEFKTPFKQKGIYIEEATGKLLCECQSERIAKALVKLLNSKG